MTKKIGATLGFLSIDEEGTIDDTSGSFNFDEKEKYIETKFGNGKNPKAYKYFMGLLKKRKKEEGFV